MKWYELALIGGAAYLILTRGAAGSAETSGVGGWGDFPASASPPLVSSPTITLSGQNVPGTTIPMSSGFAAKVAEIPAAQILTAKTADLGQISVRSAPLATNPPAVLAEVKQIFQQQYLMGNFVPSSALSGKLTKTDIMIAQNLAKKSFKI